MSYGIAVPSHNAPAWTLTATAQESHPAVQADGSALGLEWLDELAGHQQQCRGRRAILLDRHRPAVEAGASDRVAAGGEVSPPGEHVPDREHDAEVGILGVGVVVQPVVGG